MKTKCEPHSSLATSKSVVDFFHRSTNLVFRALWKYYRQIFFFIDKFLKKMTLKMTLWAFKKNWPKNCVISARASPSSLGILAPNILGWSAINGCRRIIPNGDPLENFDLPPPPRHTSATKYVCQGWTSSHANFHNNRTMWTKILLVKICWWGGGGKSQDVFGELWAPN